MSPRGFTELYPPDVDTATAQLWVEIKAPWETGLDDWFELVLVKNATHRGGLSFQIPVRTIERARTQARILLALFANDLARVEVVRAEQRELRDVERAAEYEARRVVEEAAHADRLAQVTPDTERVTKYECPTCSDLTDDLEDWQRPVYECSRCGGHQVGEGENRCESDNVFMAKVGTMACPSCDAPLEEGDEPQPVVGVEVDGVFIPEAELQAATS